MTIDEGGPWKKVILPRADPESDLVLKFGVPANGSVPTWVLDIIEPGGTITSEVWTRPLEVDEAEFNAWLSNQPIDETVVRQLVASFQSSYPDLL